LAVNTGDGLDVPQRRQAVHGVLKSVGHEHVVSVEEQDHVRVEVPQPRVARGREAAVGGVADEGDAPILRLERLDDAADVLGRRVVDDDAPPTRVRLVAHALQRCAQEAGVAIRRDDHPDRRLLRRWKERHRRYAEGIQLHLRGGQRLNRRDGRPDADADPAAEVE
jgi:hypothetical protein